MLVVYDGNSVVSAATLVGMGSTSMAELSVVDSTMEDASCTMEVVSREVDSEDAGIVGYDGATVIDARRSELVLAGRSVIENGMKENSTVAAALEVTRLDTSG